MAGLTANVDRGCVDGLHCQCNQCGWRTHEHVDAFQNAFLGAGFQGIDGVDAATQTVHFPIARNKRTNTVGWHDWFQMFDGDGGLLAGLPPLLNRTIIASQAFRLCLHRTKGLTIVAPDHAICVIF
jgi:hypothetical protein